MTDFDRILQLIRVRASARAFDSDYELTKEALEYLLRATDLGPSSGGLYAYNIYHTEDRNLKKEAQDAALDQGFISQAASVFCIVAVPAKSEAKYGERGMLYAIQDATIAGMNINFVATALGLGTCWVGSIEVVKMRKIFNIPEEEIPLSLICIGRRKR